MCAFQFSLGLITGRISQSNQLYANERNLFMSAAREGPQYSRFVAASEIRPESWDWSEKSPISVSLFWRERLISSHATAITNCGVRSSALMFKSRRM